MRKLVFLLVAIGLIFSARMVMAVPVTCIEGCTTNGAISVANTHLWVSPTGGNFNVKNLGSYFSIANVYVDFDPRENPGMAGFSVIGASFVPGGSPGNLPGGISHGFSADFVWSAENPKPHNGLNTPGDIFDAFFPHVPNMLDLYNQGLVAFGFHLIGFEDGGSVSLLAKGGQLNSVPEPTSLLLLGTGVIGLIGYTRSRNRK